MFIVLLLVTAEKWKQLKCSSAVDWIKKMWYSHTMECYSAEKEAETKKERGEVLIYTIKWINPENRLTERSRTRGPHYSMIPFI